MIKKLDPVTEIENIVVNRVNVDGIVYPIVDEKDVISLFYKIAIKFDILVELIQRGSPNCIAKRYIGANIWDTIKIGIEFNSSNFGNPFHNSVEDINMLVCWEHDWNECPRSLEVFELQKEIAQLDDVRIETPAVISRNRVYDVISVE